MTFRKIHNKTSEIEDIVPKLASIYKEVFNQTPWNEHWTESRAKKRLWKLLRKRKSRNYLLQIDFKIAGSIFGSAVFPFPHLWFIHELFIDPIFQGRGYGVYLFKMYLRKLQKAKVKRVLLLTDRKRIAPLLIKRFGFEVLFPFLKFRHYCLLTMKL
jgi:GNAT superfamily N-acetyltransferase